MVLFRNTKDMYENDIKTLEKGDFTYGSKNNNSRTGVISSQRMERKTRDRVQDTR